MPDGTGLRRSDLLQARHTLHRRDFSKNSEVFDDLQSVIRSIWLKAESWLRGALLNSKLRSARSPYVKRNKLETFA